MSITAETCKEHAKDPAVLCCRAEAGITIGPENLEDPAIFDDLVDSGLLKLDGCLTIEEILGAKLTKTCDSLTPITADVVEGAKLAAPAVEEVVEEAAPVAAAPVVAGATTSVARCKQAAEMKSGALKCERPGNCPGQVKNSMQFKKDKCEYIVIGNCSDCSNTVMGSAPKMGLKVFHQTDHIMRTIGHPLYRYLRVSKKVDQDI